MRQKSTKTLQVKVCCFVYLKRSPAAVSYNGLQTKGDAVPLRFDKLNQDIQM